MLRILARLITLMLTFTAEIRVHADADVWRREPNGCVATKSGCAWMAKVSKSVWVKEGLMISAESGAIIVWNSDREVTLTRGDLLVSASDGFTVKTRNGRFNGRGSYLFSVGLRNTVVTALAGDMTYIPRGQRAQSFHLPEGYRVEVAGILMSGEADVQIPQPAPLASTIKSWWALFPGKKAEFLERAMTFAKGASDRAERYADWQKQHVQREVAALRERERREAEVKRREELEKAKTRALFKKLNYVGEEFPD